MIRYLLSKNRAEQGRMFAVVVLGALIGLLPIHLFRLIIDRAIPARDTTLLLSLAAVLLCAMLAAGWCNYMKAVLARRIQEFFVADMRLKLMAHIMDLPSEYFAANPVGKLLNRIMHDVARFGMGIEWLLINPVIAVATLVFYMAYLLSIDAGLTALALLALPPMLFVTTRATGQLARHRGVVVAAAGNFSATVNELMLASMEIQSNGSYRRSAARLRHDHEVLSAAGVGEASLLARIATASSMYREFVPILIYLYGAWLAMRGTMSVGSVVAFAAAFGGLYQAIETLVNYFPVYQNVRDRYGELGSMLDTPRIGPPSVTAAFSVAESAPPQGGQPAIDLLLHDLSYAHASGARVVDSVQAVIAAGQHVAIIGRSGCGKSTLLNLLAGRLQPDGGAIRYGALPHSELATAQRVALISYVQQTPFLFAGSLRSNLLYGVADDGDGRSDEDLLDICDKTALRADLLQFGLETCIAAQLAGPYLALRDALTVRCVRAGMGGSVRVGWDEQQSIRVNLLPQGLELDDIAVARTAQQAIAEAVEAACMGQALRRLGMDFEVGERGARLSGGQRQKVSIARALLRRRPLLLLDEVTASLDRDSARTVMDLLRHELAGVTVIAITHELELLDAFDRVIALRDGRIVADMDSASFLADPHLQAAVLQQREGGPA